MGAGTVGTGVDSDQAYGLPVVEGRRAWVSEGTLTGDDGLEAADALCVAEGVGLTGTARALMAMTDASAISRFDVSGLPWVRPDGIPVWAATATDPLPLAPLLQQLDGTAVERRVWTGALRMQELATDNCNDWTSADGAVQTRSGTSDFSGTSWYGGGPGSCDRDDQVYCLED